MPDRLLPTDLLARAFNRRRLLTDAALVAAVTLTEAGPSALSAAFDGHVERSCCPVRNEEAAPYRAVSVADLLQGNQQAIALADRSGLIAKAKENLHALAQSLPDDAIRGATLAVLDTPAPTYQLRSPSAGDREQVRQELLAEGLIADSVTVDGIYPPVADASGPAQPVWSAPGSTYGGHHSYPGGLAVHEWVNATLAKAFHDIYEAAYGVISNPPAIDVSVSLAAPLWHDIHKTVVMQWLPDGSELAEQTIADTGAHHPISGAEALVRGMSPDFVVAMLSAHDAPTNSKDTVTAAMPVLTGYRRLVNYIRAAAIIARVDPVAAGLLTRSSDGTFALQQDPPRYEGFINHLSDHDFLLSGDSAARMIDVLKGLGALYGIDAASQPARFNLFRNLVFSQVADMRLYGALEVGGTDRVRAMIDAEVDLSQLNP